MKHTLVVFHSRSGHTRRVAQALAGRLDADLEEIRTRHPRRGEPGILRCLLESVLGLVPAIRPLRHDPSRYRGVIIGMPVWAWNLPGPVRAWARGHPVGDARLAFFCTMGGSGAARVFSQLEAELGRVPDATLAVTEAQLEADLDPLLDAFVARLASLAPESAPVHARPVPGRPR